LGQSIDDIHVIEGSLEVKLPTIWTQMKSRDGKSQRREEKRIRKKIKKRKAQKKEDPGARKGKESRETLFVPMICGSGGSKSRLAKVAGAEPAGQMRDEQLHAVVARSTFAREKAKNASRAEHFWKL